MKSKIVIVLFFSMMGMTVNLCAQSEKQQKQDEITQQRLREGLARGQSKRVQMQAVPFGVNDSQYNHKEKEIMAKLNTEGIPADFPVYKSEYTEEEYTSLMNKWYETHPSLLKKENKQQ